MRQLTEEELKENDVLLIVPRNKTHLCMGRSEVANLLYGYVPRELKDGSWQYKVPAYLARDIAKVGQRLTKRALDAAPANVPEK